MIYNCTLILKKIIVLLIIRKIWLPILGSMMYHIIVEFALIQGYGLVSGSKSRLRIDLLHRWRIVRKNQFQIWKSLHSILKHLRTLLNSQKRKKMLSWWFQSCMKGRQFSLLIMDTVVSLLNLLNMSLNSNLNISVMSRSTILALKNRLYRCSSILSKITNQLLLLVTMVIDLIILSLKPVAKLTILISTMNQEWWIKQMNISGIILVILIVFIGLRGMPIFPKDPEVWKQ